MHVQSQPPASLPLSQLVPLDMVDSPGHPTFLGPRAIRSRCPGFLVHWGDPSTTSQGQPRSYLEHVYLTCRRGRIRLRDHQLTPKRWTTNALRPGRATSEDRRKKENESPQRDVDRCGKQRKLCDQGDAGEGSVFGRACGSGQTATKHTEGTREDPKYLSSTKRSLHVRIRHRQMCHLLWSAVSSSSVAVRTTFVRIFLLAQLIVIVCGRTTVELSTDFATTIVGGDPVDPPDKFPWMVALACLNDAGNRMTIWCGGSLIAPNFVLSAAHCDPGKVSECSPNAVFVIFRYVFSHYCTEKSFGESC